MIGKELNSILELIETFSSEQICIDYLEELYWSENPISPFNTESKVYKCKNNRYRCKETGKYFNVKTGTLFDNTKVKLQKWFVAIWLVTSHKKGISSIQLSKDINVTQKTAWFMLQRIRNCFGIQRDDDLEGTVEADETFVGGKNKNRHKDKKVKNSQGRSFKDKVPVMGMLQRAETEIIERPHKVIPHKTVKEKIIHKESKIVAYAITDTKGKTIQPLIYNHVKLGSRFMSDEWWAYNGLNSDYNHSIVDHSKKEYVNPNDNTIHSNTIEGSWKILKNSIRDMYNWVSKKHIQKYVDEFAFRYNTKNTKEDYRFNLMLSNMGYRLKYKDLIK